MDFETTKTEFDTCPIVLIDNSGSTSAVISKDGVFHQSVLNYELIVSKKYFESIGIKNVYLMFWNSYSQIYSHDPIPVSELTNINVYSSGGTNLGPALSAIPKSWIADKSNIELHIFTDGEI